MKWLLPPLLVAICAIVMIALHRRVPVMELLPQQLSLALGIPLIAAGLALTLIASRQFGRVGTNINTFRKPDRLVDDGVFAYSRNPMYLGFAIALFGFAVKLSTLAPFTVVIAFILVTNFWYIRFEERMAAESFGEAYERYRRRTRRWI